MQCLNVNLPSVRNNLKELTSVLGDNQSAYAVLASNNGYSMKSTPTGEVSILYKKLLDITKDPRKAIVLKTRIHSPEFKRSYGDWLNLKEGNLDINSEPELYEDAVANYFMSKDETRVPLVPGNLVFDKRISIEELSNEEIDKYLEAQYNKTSKGGIKKGSIVKYREPGKEGETILIVNKVNPHTLNTFNPTRESFSTGITRVDNRAKKYFTKVGDWPIITDKRKGADVQIMVLSRDRIANVTNIVAVNKEDKVKQTKYIEEAVNNGKKILETRKPTKSIKKPIEKDDLLAKIFKSTNEIVTGSKNQKQAIAQDVHKILRKSGYPDTNIAIEELANTSSEIVYKALARKILGKVPKGYIDNTLSIIRKLYNAPKKPVDKVEEVDTIPEDLQEFDDTDKIFIHVDNPDNLDTTITSIEKAIKDNVKTFIVPPVKFATEQDKQIREYFQNIGWVLKSKDGIDYFAKPNESTKPRVPEEEEIEEPTKVEKVTIISDSELVPTYDPRVPINAVKVEVAFQGGSEIDVMRKDDNLLVNIAHPHYMYNTLEHIKNTPHIKYIIDVGIGASEDFIDLTKSRGGYYSNIIFTKDVHKYIKEREDTDTTTETIINNESPIVDIKGIKIDLRELGMNFTLSDGQLTGLNQFAEWVEKDYIKPLAIEGIAGTGKTTVLRVARAYLETRNIETAFSALTHTSAINLEKLTGARSVTTHSILGLQPQISLDNKNELQFIELGESPAFKELKGKIVFIDEMSMASNELTNMMIEASERGDFKLVFIGSLAQISPVGKDKNNVAFNINSVDLVNLKQVQRQSKGNKALGFFKVMSTNQEKEYRSTGFIVDMYNKETEEGIVWFQKKYKSQEDTFLNAIVRAIKKGREKGDSMYSKAITYGNKTADRYNRAIRDKLGFKGLIHPGEEDIIIEENIEGKVRKGIPYRVESLEEAKIKLIPNSEHEVHVYKANLIPGIEYKIDGKPGLLQATVNIIAANDMSNNREAFEEYAQWIDSLKLEAMQATGKLRAKLTRKYLNAKVANLAMFDITLPSETIPTISRQINYAYVSTVHKAQGATYEKVYVDESNIAYVADNYLKKNKYKTYNEVLYTAATRGSKAAIIMTNKKVQDELTEDAEEKLKGTEFNSQTVPRHDSSRALTGTVESAAITFMQDNNIKNTGKRILTPTKLLEGTSMQKALYNAVPSATIFMYNELPGVKTANDYLNDNIAISETDPKIKKKTGTDDIDLYNRMVYDIYKNSMIRELTMNMNTPTLAGNIAFDIRTDHATAKLDREIKTLQEEASTIKQAGGSITEVQKILDKIQDKERTRKAINDNKDVDSLLLMAKNDLKDVQAIIDSPDISSDEFNRGMNKLNTWIEAGDFSSLENNIFLVTAEAEDPKFQDIFKNMAGDAQLLKNTLDSKGRNLISNIVSTVLSKDFTFRDLLFLKNKVSKWFGKYVYSIAKMDNPIIAYILKTVNEAKKKAEIKSITESRELAELYSDLKEEKFNLDLFWQKDADGILTGNLVSEFSSEVINRMNYLRREEGTRNKTWLLNNVEIIDTAEVIKNREAYIQKLAESLGFERATQAVNDALEKFNQYMEIKKAFMTAEFGKEITEGELNEEQQTRMNTWLEDNSPFERRALIHSSKLAYKEIPGESADRFIEFVPKQYIDGKETEHYDNNYTAIQENDTAKEFYKIASEITQKAKENFNRSGMSNYTLGHVEKTLLQEYNEKGIREFTTKSLADKTIEYFAGGKERNEVKDPVTGRVIKTVDKGVVTLEDMIMSEYLRLKADKYGTARIVNDLRVKLMQEASNNIMKQDKQDLFLALNSLNLASLTYAYKSAIKPQLDMAMHYMDQLIPGIQAEARARLVDDKDIKNAQEMVDYFMDRTFFDLGAEDKSFKLPITLYTSKDREKRKALLDRYEKIINSKAYKKGDLKVQASARNIEDELKVIGSQPTLASGLRALMDVARLTTLGWNLQSPIANLFQGQIANIIHAAEGTLYNGSDLKRAYTTLFNERTKFNNILRNYAILGDIMYDFKHKNPFEEKKKGINRFLRFLKPFEGTKLTEAANQGNIMIAMMYHVKVDNIETNKQENLWDAIDENGKLSDKYIYNGKHGDDAVAEVVIKIREQINIIHGDYTNVLMIDEKVIGKAASMMKKWFFEPFHARFGTRRYNFILKKDTKGRYLSMMDFIKNYGIKYSQFKADAKEGKVDLVEVENMRVMLLEISISVLTAALSIFAKIAMCGDDKVKCGSGASAYLVNMMKRVDSETRTFSSWKQYYDFITNPAVVVRYLKFLYRFSDYMYDLATGKGITNKEGENKMMLLIGKEIPAVRRMIIENDLAEMVRKY